MFKQMLKDLLLSYGPSGREDAAAACIERYAAPHADEIRRDALGNLIVRRAGTSGRRVMLSAHMDQIGLVVVDIDENGFLRVAPVGGVLPAVAAARAVVFAGGVRGVTGWENRKKTPATATMQELFVDIGAADRESAEALVRVGDMCVFQGEFIDMGARVACAAMDNRIACAALLETLARMQTRHEVYAVFTVQEEVGLRGAAPAAYAVEPDLNINVDTTVAADTPECARLNMALGNGPAIKAMDSSVIVPSSVRRFLVDVAERSGIPYQHEVLRSGGTDTGAVQRVRDGVLAGCLSIPTRYIHTPVETVALSDVENTVRLLCAALAEDELPAAPGLRGA